MKTTIFDTENKVEHEFSEADIREALIKHFKVHIGNNCQLYMETQEGFLSKPPIISMIVINRVVEEVAPFLSRPHF